MVEPEDEFTRRRQERGIKTMLERLQQESNLDSPRKGDKGALQSAILRYDDAVRSGDDTAREEARDIVYRLASPFRAAKILAGAEARNALRENTERQAVKPTTHRRNTSGESKRKGGLRLIK